MSHTRQKSQRNPLYAIKPVCKNYVCHFPTVAHDPPPYTHYCALWENYAPALILYCKSLVFAQKESQSPLTLPRWQRYSTSNVFITSFSIILQSFVTVLFFPFMGKNPYKGQFNPISVAHDVASHICVSETGSCLQSTSRIYHQRPPLSVTNASRFI